MRIADTGSKSPLRLVAQRSDDHLRPEALVQTLQAEAGLAVRFDDLGPLGRQGHI